MQSLINQLPKREQKAVTLAVIIAKNGNHRALDSAIRAAATKKTAGILQQIKAAI